jgi:hypothetical protein
MAVLISRSYFLGEDGNLLENNLKLPFLREIKFCDKKWWSLRSEQFPFVSGMEPDLWYLIGPTRAGFPHFSVLTASQGHKLFFLLHFSYSFNKNISTILWLNEKHALGRKRDMLVILVLCESQELQSDNMNGRRWLYV